MKTQFKFSVGDICVFTSRSNSGIRSNDGKRCIVRGVKDPEAEGWRGLLDEPGYVIEFLDTGHGFGCRESELVRDTEGKTR